VRGSNREVEVSENKTERCGCSGVILQKISFCLSQYPSDPASFLKLGIRHPRKKKSQNHGLMQNALAPPRLVFCVVTVFSNVMQVLFQVY